MDRCSRRSLGCRCSSSYKKWPHVRLLIINTPSECVIGGECKQITAAIEALQCNAFFLDGVVTVHCDAALPVRDPMKLACVSGNASR